MLVSNNMWVITWILWEIWFLSSRFPRFSEIDFELKVLFWHSRSFHFFARYVLTLITDGLRSVRSFNFDKAAGSVLASSVSKPDVKECFSKFKERGTEAFYVTMCGKWVCCLKDAERISIWRGIVHSSQFCRMEASTTDKSAGCD